MLWLRLSFSSFRSVFLSDLFVIVETVHLDCIWLSYERLMPSETMCIMSGDLGSVTAETCALQGQPLEHALDICACYRALLTFHVPCRHSCRHYTQLQTNPLGTNFCNQSRQSQRTKGTSKSGCSTEVDFLLWPIEKSSLGG